MATDSQGASPGWDTPWLSLSLFRYGGCGGAPSLPPFDTVTSLGLAQLCEHVLCKPQSRQLCKIQGPREQPQASQSAKALLIPLMLNLRPWGRSELTHRAGLCWAWLVSRTPITMQPTKQPAEESAGSFELSWMWAKIHGQGCAPSPGNPTCEKQAKCPTRQGWLSN